jgi:hypothetical protein
MPLNVSPDERTDGDDLQAIIARKTERHFRKRIANALSCQCLGDFGMIECDRVFRPAILRLREMSVNTNFEPASLFVVDDRIVAHILCRINYRCRAPCV